MDFIVFSTLCGVVLALLTLSYDICCQWSVNVQRRMRQLPRHMQINESVLKHAKRVIPKLHVHNHGPNCQADYNCNYIQYSAQSDLEDPERWWAHINPVAPSTREMTNGARLDLIDFHTVAWNWRKIVGFGMLATFGFLRCSSHVE